MDHSLVVEPRLWVLYRLLWLLLATTVLLALFFYSKPAYAASEVGLENGVLIYSGYYPYKNTGLTEAAGEQQTLMQDGGEWLPSHFRPYVTHLNAHGRPDDTFFDTFIFLGIKSVRGRSFLGEQDQDKAALWYDWQWYLNRLFTAGKHLDALNTAVAEAEAALGKPMVTDVYLMIPYPSYKVTDFGTTTGEAGGDSLLPVENRLKAVEWYVNEVQNQWRNTWTHLRLVGFYWVQEHFNPAVPGETELVTGAAKIVHNRGYKLGWIPWSGAYLATNWRSYDFDWAVTQPNHFLQTDKPYLLEQSVRRAKDAGMGWEIELDGRVLEPAGEQKLYDYLNTAVANDLTKGIRVYYQDAFMLAKLQAADSSKQRIYDDVYAFTKNYYPNPTPVANRLQGRVLDVNGNPVAGAVVSGAGRQVETSADGSFTLWAYDTTLEITIKKAGYAILSAQTTAVDGQGFPNSVFTLPAGNATLLNNLDNNSNLSALGLRLEMESVQTEGKGAVKATVLSTLNSLWFDASRGHLATTDWQNHSMLAFDVRVESQSQVKLVVSIVDGTGAIYTRTVYGKPGVWQVVSIPLTEAAKGILHDAKEAGRTSNGVDVTRISRVSLSIKAGSNTKVLFDNLRIDG